MKSSIQTINTKQLRGELRRIIERTRRDASFLVLHRNRPAFQIVPANTQHGSLSPLETDTVYGAEAVGRSNDGLRAADHHDVLYRR